MGGPERPTTYRISDWHRLKAQSPDAWRGHLSIIEATVTHESFKEDVQAQAWVIAFLREFAGVGGEVLAPIAGKVMAALGLGEARFQFLLSLSRMRDLRAALKARYVEPGPRRQHEEVYPKDGWLGAYLQYVQETPVPMAFHFWTGVALLGAAARRNVYIQAGSYYLYPNQYLVLVGELALGKSLAIAGQGTGRAILAEANRLLDEWLLEQVQVNDHVYQRAMSEGLEDLSVTVMPDKVTPQSLISRLAADSKNRRLLGPDENPLLVTPRQSVGWLGNDELSTLVGRRVHDSDQMIHTLTALYNCPDAWDAGTITRGIDRLRDMALTFVGGSTMEWINTSMTPDMFEGGFMSRVMYVHRPDRSEVRSYELFEPPLDPLQRHALASTLIPLMLLPEMECEPTEGAERVLVGFKEETRALREAPDSPRMAQYYARRDNHLMKLGMALALSDLLGRFGWDMTSRDIEGLGVIPLRKNHLEHAWEILTAEERFIPQCFARIGEHEDHKAMEYLVGLVRSHNVRTGKAISRGQLADRMRRQYGNKWWHHLEAAVETGAVQQIRSTTRGPRTVKFWATGVGVAGDEESPSPGGSEGLSGAR